MASAGPVKFSDEHFEKKYAVGLTAYRAGATLTEAGSAQGISAVMMWKVLVRLGIPRRRQGVKQSPERLREKYGPAIRAYQGGMNCATAARTTGTSRHTLYSVLGRLGELRRR